MNFKNIVKKRLLTDSGSGFEQLAMEIFNYQAENNSVYRSYIQNLQIDHSQVKQLTDIPFLPIDFFKNHDIKTGDFAPETIFKSSGTTLQQRSCHSVKSVEFYLQHAKTIFEQFYGKLTDFTILALLPSYLEQGESSLVAMVDYFIKQTGQSLPGFYLDDLSQLVQDLEKAKNSGKKVLLIGVTYALLDVADQFTNLNLSNVIVMETGGMKGRRKEMIREELHTQLKNAFQVDQVHSEYGMTELLSQAYSKGKGIFETPWPMKIILRDLNDPFDKGNHIKTGGINVIDLANIDSCCFIETKDIGKQLSDTTFEVLGRFDNSDIRGCNLLVTT